MASTSSTSRPDTLSRDMSSFAEQIPAAVESFQSRRSRVKTIRCRLVFHAKSFGVHFSTMHNYSSVYTEKKNGPLPSCSMSRNSAATSSAMHCDEIKYQKRTNDSIRNLTVQHMIWRPLHLWYPVILTVINTLNLQKQICIASRQSPASTSPAIPRDSDSDGLYHFQKQLPLCCWSSIITRKI